MPLKLFQFLAIHVRLWPQMICSEIAAQLHRIAAASKGKQLTLADIAPSLIEFGEMINRR